MTIHELSFQSINSIPTVSYYNHRITLNQALAPAQLPSELGKLATRLRQQTGMSVVAETTEFCLISPYQLTSNNDFEILSVLAVDITASRYRRQLEQMLNQCVCEFFKNRRLRVDTYKRKAFLETVEISDEIEAQRVLKWNLRIDKNNNVFLPLDYSNEYYSRFTLEQRDLSSLSPDQPLVHTYDGKTCRYARLAGFTVSSIRSELGNKSLLDFHREKGESEQVLSAISPETPATLVNYGSKGKDVIYSHIPQLLKKTFTKDDIESRVFNAQVLSIDDRFKRAIKGIDALNKSGGLNIPGINIIFNTSPYCPETQKNFAEIKDNLDFGGGCFGSYPAQGLSKRKLLEKPDNIKVIVFSPENYNITNWCNLLKNFFKSFNIQMELLEFRSYSPTNIIEIQRKCRNLKNSELALMFVPDKEDFISTPKFDPYPILKREFIKVMLPSQATEESTLRSGFNSNTGFSLLLQILGKLGYCPWQLKNMPGKAEAQAFLGLDIGRKDGVAVGVAACVVSPQGRVIGWFPATFQAHRETFDISALHSIIFDLIHLYEQKYQTRLTHLIIHRDGTFQADELDLLDELTPELNAAGIQKIDMVEILKSGYPCAGQWNEKSKKWENPRRGWAWSISDTKVAIMTIGQTEIKGGTNFVPRPIIVRRRRGDTKIGTLAAQVYWLSEMHVGSTQTIRLPITTYYPHKAAESVLEGLLPTGLQIGGKLPF